MKKTEGGKKMLLIGITPDWDREKGKVTVNRDYMDAVSRAGAVPVLLPLTGDVFAWEEIVSRVDGLLFSGGGDIDPRMYGEEKLPCCGEVSPERDWMEMDLLRLALDRDVPVLAVCRGLQVMNCALGGTLYQDILAQYAGALCHPREDVPREKAHDVMIPEGRLLRRILGVGTLAVNSRHHQGIKALGQGLLPCAIAPDGLIEGIEMPGKRFALGVQWHPESMCEKHPEQQAIFNAFTEACNE